MNYSNILAIFACLLSLHVVFVDASNKRRKDKTLRYVPSVPSLSSCSASNSWDELDNDLRFKEKQQQNVLFEKIQQLLASYLGTLEDSFKAKGDVLAKSLSKEKDPQVAKPILDAFKAEFAKAVDSRHGTLETIIMGLYTDPKAIEKASLKHKVTDKEFKETLTAITTSEIKKEHKEEKERQKELDSVFGKPKK